GHSVRALNVLSLLRSTLADPISECAGVFPRSSDGGHLLKKSRDTKARSSTKESRRREQRRRHPRSIFPRLTRIVSSEWNTCGHRAIKTCHEPRRRVSKHGCQSQRFQV